RIFDHQWKKTFATQSAQSGLTGMSAICPLSASKRTCHEGWMLFGLTQMTRMNGLAVRCKKALRMGQGRSCINGSGLGSQPFVPRAIMDISAPAISLAVRPQWGHLGHQCSHAPGRPILHLVIFSQTSAG